MEFQQVRYFLALCVEKNFTRAAKRCAVKQPSLTAAIRKLECEVGGKLFLRSSPVVLTELGLALYPICIQINELVERARVISEESPRIRLGNGKSQTSISEVDGLSEAG